MNMHAGHAGASKRYEWIEEEHLTMPLYHQLANNEYIQPSSCSGDDCVL